MDFTSAYSIEMNIKFILEGQHVPSFGQESSLFLSNVTAISSFNLTFTVVLVVIISLYSLFLLFITSFHLFIVVWYSAALYNSLSETQKIAESSE